MLESQFPELIISNGSPELKVFLDITQQTEYSFARSKNLVSPTAQLNTKSSRTYLQISRLLKADPWKPAGIWNRKIEGKVVP